MPISLQVNNLNKNFAGKQAVSDFSMDAYTGEIVGFIGPNGSGKTTVIRMICGLLKPDSGHGQCLGYDIETQAAKIRDKLGYMPQSFGLYEYMTVYENLYFMCQLYQLKNIKQRIQTMVESIHLGEYLHQRAGNLSGGWKQRLSLAASLINDPELLLLDEPTAGVDPNARLEFWNIIREVADRGTTVLVSTHHMSELERCDRVVYLVYGKVIAQGTSADIIANANTHTWQVTGKNIHEIANELRSLPGVNNVIEFGRYLHVSGTNQALLINSLQPYFSNVDYELKLIDTTLEDILINLISDKVKSNND